MPIDIEARLDEIFAAPIEEFTATRNALVKELSEAGDKEAANRVKALKKPTAVVWAVNQLAHRHGPQLEELVRLHEKIASAKGAAAMRKISDERRRVVGRLTNIAGRALTGAGRPPTSATTQKISQTLLSATSGEQLEALRWGRLTSELEGPGFGALEGFDAAATSAPYEKVDRKGQEKAAKLRTVATEAEREADELARAAAKAEREAQRLATEAKKARERADKARARADSTGQE